MPISKEEFLAGFETSKVSISEDKIMDLLEDSQYYGTKEIAEHLFGDDATQSNKEAVLTKLKGLMKEGRIQGKKIGMGYFWGRA